jgi:transmembrane sensor
MSEEQGAIAVEPDRLEQAAEWWVTLEETAEHKLPPAVAAAWQGWKSDPENWKAFQDISRLPRDVKTASWPASASAEALANDQFEASTSVAAWRNANQSEYQGRGRGEVEKSATHAHGGPVARNRVPPDPRTYRHRRILLVVAGAAASAVLAFAVVRGTQFSRFYSAFFGPSEVYETQLGEHRQVILPDGSTVELGARTALTAHYTEQRRTVVLNHGVAIFNVEHNITRPFVVEVGRGSVTAVGTAFQVLEDRSRTVVTVSEGTVLVAPHEPGTSNSSQTSQGAGQAANWATATVSRGEQVTIESNGAAAAVARVDPDVATAWRDGRLQYLGEPLRHVIADVNRYSRRRLSCDESACSLLYTGTVFERDVDAWISGLPRIFPVEITETDSENVVLRSR